MTAAPIPTRARGDLGDRLINNRLGGASFASSTNTENDITVQSVTAPYEAAIRRLFRTFLNTANPIASEKFEYLQTLESEAGGRLDPNSEHFGYYRRSLELICRGNLRAIANLSGTPDQEVVPIGRSGFASFPINLADVHQFEPELYKWFHEFPADTIFYADDEIKLVISSEIAVLLPELRITGARVSPYGLLETRNIREMDPTDIETLVTVKALCSRATNLIPEMQICVYRCMGRNYHQNEVVGCSKELSFPVLDGTATEPNFCSGCQKVQSFVMQHDRSIYWTKQVLKVQENHDTVPAGQTPQSLLVTVYDDMVDYAQPGDVLIITGIYKALPIEARGRTNIHQVFLTSIDAVNIQRETATKLRMDDQLAAGSVSVPLMLNPAFVTKARALAAQQNLMQILIDSFAPNIWEHRDIKKGLLCQLFGAPAEYHSTLDARMTSRGSIHVLLCGDPSTAKSQLMLYVHKLTQRGVYCVGRGTSTAGLSASIMKDPLTKEFTVEPGALMLSDLGICCIDEFDKMADDTREVLHEVMEDQCISLAKASVVSTLNARTAILASSNPIKSKYDVRKSVIENINLPPTLISRFDLIFLVLDSPNPSLDGRLADHICGLYTKKTDEATTVTANKNVLDQDFLADYISFARRTCNPEISDRAFQEIIETYVALRTTDYMEGSVSATPRQIDSLKRLGKAFARMELSPTVEPRHIKEAGRLIKAATYQALTDPFTGRIDFQQLHAGASETARVRHSYLGDVVLQFLRQHDAAVDKEAIQTHVEERLAQEGQPALTSAELDRAMQHFEAIGLVARAHGGKFVALEIS